MIPISTAPKDGTFILLAWIDSQSLAFKIERGAYHVGYNKWHTPSEGFNVVPQWWAESPPHPISTADWQLKRLKCAAGSPEPCKSCESSGVCLALEDAKEFNQPMPRGGYRPNARRPKVLPEGTKQWNIQVTDDEKAKIKALLEELRKPSK